MQLPMYRQVYQQAIAIAGINSIPARQLGIDVIQREIIEKINKSGTDYLIRNSVRTATGVGKAGLKRVVGIAALVADALSAGSVVGGAVVGAVNPYGEEGKNPYSLLKEEGRMPFGLGMSELGWELGSRLRNLWDEKLSDEVQENLISLQRQLNQIQQTIENSIQQLREKDLRDTRQSIKIPPLEFDFGKVFPDLEDISPIKLDLGDLGKELSLLDTPIENLEINKEINKLPDVVIQKTEKVSLISPKNFHLDSNLNWDNIENDLGKPYSEKIIESKRNIPKEFTSNWVLVSVKATRHWKPARLNYSNDAELKMGQDRFFFNTRDGSQDLGEIKFWAYNIKDFKIVQVSDFTKRNIQVPFRFGYYYISNSSTYFLGQYLYIKAERVRSWISTYPNTPFYPDNLNTIKAHIPHYSLAYYNGFFLVQTLNESYGEISRDFTPALPILSEGSLTYFKFQYAETIPTEFTIEINGLTIPLTEEQSTPFERENSFMKCKAFDAVKALDSRIKALELKVQVLDTKVGKNALSEIEISVDKLDQFGNPVKDKDGNVIKEKQKIAIDGISGGVGRLLQEGTNLQGIQELKELIGPKVDKIIIPPLKQGDRPQEMKITGGLGQLATLTTTNAIDINQKLGKSIEGEEIEIFNPETGVMEKTAIAGGIGAATILTAKNFNQFRQKFEKVRQWLMSGRILEVLTLAATLHNAHQLSVSIIDTLVQAAQNLIEAIGLKDDEGNTIDLHEMMRKSMEQIMISILGQEAYETAKRKWDRYNRIYQSASNILSAMTSIINALQDTTEIIGSYVGKIGNALKKYHVIADNAYEWMAEKMSAKNRWQRRLNALVEGLEQAENISSNLEQITSNTLEVVQQSQELVKESRELKKLLSENEPDEKNENKVVAEQQKLNAEVSKPPEIKEEDIMFVANKD